MIFSSSKDDLVLFSTFPTIMRGFAKAVPTSSSAPSSILLPLSIGFSGQRSVVLPTTSLSSFHVVSLVPIVLVASPLSAFGSVLSSNLVLSLVVLVFLSTEPSVASSLEFVAGDGLEPSSASPDEFLGISAVLLTFSSAELRLPGLKIEIGNVADLSHYFQPVCEQN